MARFGLLWAGVFLTLIMSVLSFTPFDWEVEKALWGVPDQYYPELFWLLFGMPVAILVLSGGAAWAWLTRPKQPL